MDFLERLRAICVKLPDTSERLSLGAPSFFYRDEIAGIVEDAYATGAA